MTDFVILWWTAGQPVLTDEDNLKKFLRFIDVKEGGLTPAGIEHYRAMRERVEFTQQHGGELRIDRSREITHFRGHDGKSEAFAQMLGIIAHFPDDRDAVHYRLLFDDEPYIAKGPQRDLPAALLRQRALLMP